MRDQNTLYTGMKFLNKYPQCFQMKLWSSKSFNSLQIKQLAKEVIDYPKPK